MDDDGDIRAVFQEGLESNGFEVVPAATVNGALTLSEITEIIQKKLSNPSARVAMKKERVPAILERDMDLTIQHWTSRIETTDELTAVPLTSQERNGHLPLLLGDLVRRLRLAPTAKVPISAAAREHGILRHKQGYSVAMLVEESRILQVSIFRTLQNNLGSVDSALCLST